MIKQQQGVSLIELIIFIVVLGILGSSILIAFVVALEQTPDIQRISRATEIADSRMAFVLSQLSQDFNLTTDPCGTLPVPTGLSDICDVPSGYAITTTLTTNNQFKHIAITVTNTSDNEPLATLQTTVADYS